MTLYRQLIIFTLLLFLLLFTGTWLAKLKSTRSFLVDQLESHAQDTATSLGLSISQHAVENDMPAIESMVNAVFDRGYYRIVRFNDTKGNVLIERVLNVTIENVPVAVDLGVFLRQIADHLLLACQQGQHILGQFVEPAGDRSLLVRLTGVHLDQPTDQFRLGSGILKRVQNLV